MPADWTVQPHGAIDIAVADRLRCEWYGVVEERRPERFVLDLTHVVFMGAVGVDLLAGVARRQREHGGRTAVRNPSGQVLKILRITGMARTVEVLPLGSLDHA